MNRKIMVIWGLLVILICSALIILGFTKKDRTLIKLENTIIKISKKYIKEKNINIDKTYVIQINDLIDNKYLEYTDDIEKYCIKSIIVTSDLLYNNYEINKECE